MLKFSGSLILRLGTRATLRKYTSGVAAFKSDKLEINQKLTTKSPKSESVSTSDNPGLVAVAFASLNSPDDIHKKPSPKSVKLSRVQMLDAQILKASDVNSLLVVAENAIVSRRHALKIVSILSEWSSNNKVKLADFEKDPRFLKLCRILARTPSAQAVSSLTVAEDLSTVLGITGDDEAARLITNLTLPQMIKVMKALQQKGRRSTPLLRALSHSITKQPEVLDLKKSADLLFSMAALNFPDPILLDRICNDVVACLPENEERGAAVGSVARSLGVLRWRHAAALEALARWLQARPAAARAPDVAALLVTLATLDVRAPFTDHLCQMALSLREEEVPKPSMWLDVVFSLLTLERATLPLLVSALRPEFIERLLSSGEISVSSRRKLAMIESYVALVTSGAGPRLADGVAGGAAGGAAPYARDKLAYVAALMDAVHSLVSADAFLRRGCDSAMGFTYEAEFALDSKCHPVPLEKAANDKSARRVAVVALHYHDMSRRAPAPLGLYRLVATLLQMKGYKVLLVPYTEFNPKDKLVTRVQYIEKRLKELVAAS